MSMTKGEGGGRGAWKMLKLAAVFFYCPDLHCTKFHFTASAVDFEESTSLQCFTLYGTDCTTLLEFKAIVKLPINVQCIIELFITML